jgi:hypothetical protein
MKAGIADSEKTSNARQWSGKYISTITNNSSTIEELLEAVFSIQSVPRLYKEK